jgi:carbamate kinase
MRVVDELTAGEFAEGGSMAPKVRAACAFVERTGGTAAIGSITDIEALLQGDAGTTVALAAAQTT